MTQQDVQLMKMLVLYLMPPRALVQAVRQLQQKDMTATSKVAAQKAACQAQR